MYKQTNVTVEILIKQHPILLQIKSNQISNTFANKTFQDRYAQMQNKIDQRKVCWARETDKPSEDRRCAQ